MKKSVRTIQDRAMLATVTATKDQLDEVEAAHAAYTILRENYRREFADAYQDNLRELRKKQ